MNQIKAFVRDESGAITVDFTVFWGGLLMMGYTVVGDVSVGVMTASNKINAKLEEIAAVHLLLEEAEASVAQGSSTATGSTETSPQAPGNPGNHIGVGNSGENPNGNGDWGEGDHGQAR